jgi:DNA polymerase-1
MGSVPILPDRTLLVDGDGLAYYCAGNDDTSTGEARMKLIDKIKSAQRIVGAGRVLILLTLSGSHKGHRYAVARVKPYQGQRANSRRPKNWQYLRELMESGALEWNVQGTSVAEADDLFGWHAYNFPEQSVLYTQDKDMRMLPGMHLDWVSHVAHTVSYDLSVCRDEYRMFNVMPHDSVHNDKQYGPRWFWMQMLHGDNADNIPGLPLARCKYGGGPITPDGKLNKVGEAAAPKILDAHSDLTLAGAVELAYRSYYGDRWLVEMMEQACLLWMRRTPDKWDDFLDPGGPLAIYNDGSDQFAKAYFEIETRVRNADNFNAASAQDD